MPNKLICTPADYRRALLVGAFHCHPNGFPIEPSEGFQGTLVIWCGCVDWDNRAYRAHLTS